jgi:hypothetical protein
VSLKSLQVCSMLKNTSACRPMHVQCGCPHCSKVHAAVAFDAVSLVVDNSLS